MASLHTAKRMAPALHRSIRSLKMISESYTRLAKDGALATMTKVRSPPCGPGSPRSSATPGCHNSLSWTIQGNGGWQAIKGSTDSPGYAELSNSHTSPPAPFIQPRTACRKAACTDFSKTRTAISGWAHPAARATGWFAGSARPAYFISLRNRTDCRPQTYHSLSARTARVTCGSDFTTAAWLVIAKGVLRSSLDQAYGPQEWADGPQEWADGPQEWADGPQEWADGPPE